MNENEDYFRISQQGSVYTLSDRIAFKGIDLLIAPVAVFIPMIAFLGWFQGLIAALLTFAIYSGYRYLASLKYNEFQIDTSTCEVFLVKKQKDKELDRSKIDDHFDRSKIVYEEMNRSGTTKYLLRYYTDTNYDLLMIKTPKDKDTIERFFAQL